jgi:ATP-dependent exoDNAse (exonuclease V) alpha subunit
MSSTKRIEINDRFRHALQWMEHTDQCLFITGRAGTGKSTLLSQFVARTCKKPVVLAPTGVAALNVKGQTIHKFFRFYVDVTPEKIRKKHFKPRNPKLYAKLKTIIIDEVSMVRADLLDCIDVFLRMYGPDGKQPFGGVQMVFIGDLYQLPPVVSRDAEEIFNSHYETPYFFSAHCLKEATFSVIALEKIYRQKEQSFVELLNRVRDGAVTEADLAALNARFRPEHQPRSGTFFINLTTTNARADAINTEHLEALPGKAQVTNARIDGEFTPDYFPTAESLKFKRGAQVMLITNDTQGRWVNGSVGVIETIARDDDDRAYVRILLQGEDAPVDVYPHSWEVYRYAVQGGEITAEPIGSFTQFPFRLAWAVTIHKAQGKTFDHVMIDLDRGTFAPGQMYVALSRCTTLEGIVLKTKVTHAHIRTDARIVEFMAQHPYTPPAETLSADEALEAPASVEEAERPLRSSFAEAQRLIAQIVEGVDPVTSERLAEDSPYRHPKILQALRTLLDARPPRASRAARDGKSMPEGLTNHGKSWSQQERTEVAERFKANLPIREIAALHQRTTGSIRSELIKQGLITLDHRDVA